MTEPRQQEPSHPDELAVRCCIVGGGPAGLMLALLLARAGVEVLVLEKHADFLRDFRGDTIHPSTLEVMKDLGLLQDFLALPHRKVEAVSGRFGERLLTLADFSHLPVACPYVAFMPQWDFLDFLARQAERFPNFRLLREVEAQGLIERDGRVAGVEALGRRGETRGRFRILADLVVAADGRHSVIREAAGLPVERLGAPIDVLWFRLPRDRDGPEGVFGIFRAGAILVLLDRGETWQCGFVIAKGTLAELKARGLPALKRELAAAAPFLASEIETLRDWEEIRLLSVQVDRLRRWWRPGLLCIGDAAHAMSPVGGVGINLAIQDAVAAANLLAEALREGPPPDDLLARLERRRALPTRITQRAQLLIQNRVLKPLLGSQEPVAPPLLLRLLTRFPLARRLPGRLIGLGIRPEHPHVSMTHG